MLPPIRQPERKGDAMKFNSANLFQRLGWLPAKIIIYGCFRLQARGLGHLANLPGNVIFAGNHVSAIDPLLIVTCLPFASDKLPIIYVTHERKTYLKKGKTWRRYFYGGKFFEMLGGYPAYAGAGDYGQALQNHLAALAAGRSVCIFPVGQLHGIRQIPEARGGVSYLAKKTGLAIIPFRIKGLRRQTRLVDFLLRKARLRISFGEPVWAEDIFAASAGQVDKSDRKEFKDASVELMRRVARL